MLVKELRQGIQSGAFAWTFVGLQVAMFLIMAWILTLMGDGYTVQAREFNVLSWAAVGMAMVVLIPLRGLGAIAAERTGSNLDLVRLTHLSAARIVAGKWLALVSQSLLLATAVLPYLVLRYFFGGIDVLRDLEIFAWLAAAAMLVVAAAVALSTVPLWLRIGTCVGVASFVPLVADILDDTVFSSGLTGIDDPLLVRLGVAALIAVYIVACLEFAAGRIAAAAESHAARSRLLALSLAVAWVVLGWAATGDAAFIALVAGGPLLLASCIGALVERPTRLATVFAPFARRGPVGRLAAMVLAPGWPTGLVFLALVWVLFMAGWVGVLSRQSSQFDRDLLNGVTLGCLLAATIVFPLPLLVYLPRTKLPLLLYVLAQLACFLVFVYSGAAWSDARRWEETWAWTAVLPFPLAALLSFASSSQSLDRMAGLAPPFLAAALIVGAITLVAVAPSWIREMRALGRMLAAARRGRNA